MSGQNSLAEREGFEPPIPFQVCPLSRRIVSTTHAPLRVGRTRAVVSRHADESGLIQFTKSS